MPKSTEVSKWPKRQPGKKKKREKKKQINVIIFLVADILHLVKYHTKLQQQK